MRVWTITIHGRGANSAKIPETIRKAASYCLTNLPASVLKKRLAKRKGPYHLEITLLSPEKIRKLNLRYRRKNRPTDVLSFSTLDLAPIPGPTTQLGELFLCIAVIRKQAKDWNVPLEEEITRMTIHGILHLFGFDHETNEKEAKRMFRLQERLVDELRQLIEDVKGIRYL